MLYRHTITVFCIVFLTNVTIKSFGCSCVGKDKQTTESALKYSDLVVKGKIVSVSNFDYYDTARQTLNGFKLHSEDAKYFIRSFRLHTFIVKDKYKSVIGMTDTIRIVTGYGGGDCGYNFEVGRKYIIYGNTWEDIVSVQQEENKEVRKIVETIIPNTFFTDICTLTQIANKAEIKKLHRLTQ